MNAVAAEIAALVFGPALPALDDVAAEFPRWHCWEGLSGLVFYARLKNSSPPVVVRAATALALRTEIADTQDGHAPSGRLGGQDDPGGLGILIRDLRLALGWSQSKLAAELCCLATYQAVTRECVSRWENGKRLPGPFWLPHLAEALQVPLRELEREKMRRRDMLKLSPAGHDMRTMPLGDPDLWIAIAARAGATDEEIAEAGPVPVSHVRAALRAKGFDR